LIKLTGTNEKGEEVLCIGLSQGNWDRLLQDKPIRIDLADLGMGWKGEILIFGDETEQAMIHRFSRMGVIKDVPVRRFDEGKEQQR
jgi:hypothetical protein